jgi:two-component system chemotaxis response regulator CheB
VTADAATALAPAVETIAIGASAGGLRPLQAIVAQLPGDLEACVIVVVHVSATGTSVLPQILARAGTLEVLGAEDGLELRPGRVIVATPDQHVLVDGGRVRLSRGPRENGHRPAIDPLMRSVAHAFGPRGAGVILSGARDDGTQGLAEIKRRGGIAFVQDPAECEYPSMPSNAIAATVVDAVLPASDIAAALAALSRNGHVRGRAPAVTPLAAANGESLAITCPECGGVLTETDDAGVLHFRCHVGHAFSPRSLLSMHAEGVERAMWTAARSLEDRGALLRRMAERARAAGHERSAGRFDGDARQAHAEAEAIRAAIAALDDTLIADAANGEEAVS